MLSLLFLLSVAFSAILGNNFEKLSGPRYFPFNVTVEGSLTLALKGDCITEQCYIHRENHGFEFLVLIRDFGDFYASYPLKHSKVDNTIILEYPNTTINLTAQCDSNEEPCSIFYIYDVSGGNVTNAVGILVNESGPNTATTQFKVKFENTEYTFDDTQYGAVLLVSGNNVERRWSRKCEGETCISEPYPILEEKPFLTRWLYLPDFLESNATKAGDYYAVVEDQKIKIYPKNPQKYWFIGNKTYDYTAFGKGEGYYDFTANVSDLYLYPDRPVEGYYVNLSCSTLEQTSSYVKVQCNLALYNQSGKVKDISNVPLHVVWQFGNEVPENDDVTTDSNGNFTLTFSRTGYVNITVYPIIDNNVFQDFYLKTRIIAGTVAVYEIDVEMPQKVEVSKNFQIHITVKTYGNLEDEDICVSWEGKINCFNLSSCTASSDNNIYTYSCDYTINFISIGRNKEVTVYWKKDPSIFGKGYVDVYYEINVTNPSVPIYWIYPKSGDFEVIGKISSHNLTIHLYSSPSTAIICPDNKSLGCRVETFTTSMNSPYIVPFSSGKPYMFFDVYAKIYNKNNIEISDVEVGEEINIWVIARAYGNFQYIDREEVCLNSTCKVVGCSSGENYVAKCYATFPYTFSSVGTKTFALSIKDTNIQNTTQIRVYKDITIYNETVGIESVTNVSGNAITNRIDDHHWNVRIYSPQVVLEVCPANDQYKCVRVMVTEQDNEKAISFEEAEFFVIVPDEIRAGVEYCLYKDDDFWSREAIDVYLNNEKIGEIGVGDSQYCFSIDEPGEYTLKFVSMGQTIEKEIRVYSIVEILANDNIGRIEYPPSKASCWVESGEGKCKVYTTEPVTIAIYPENPDLNPVQATISWETENYYVSFPTKAGGVYIPNITIGKGEEWKVVYWDFVQKIRDIVPPSTKFERLVQELIRKLNINDRSGAEVVLNEILEIMEKGETVEQNVTIPSRNMSLKGYKPIKRYFRVRVRYYYKTGEAEIEFYEKSGNYSDLILVKPPVEVIGAYGTESINSTRYLKFENASSFKIKAKIKDVMNIINNIVIYTFESEKKIPRAIGFWANVKKYSIYGLVLAIVSAFLIGLYNAFEVGLERKVINYLKERKVVDLRELRKLGSYSKIKNILKKLKREGKIYVSRGKVYYTE